MRVPGIAVFMYSNPHGVPPALLHNLKHNHVLHETVIILTVETQEIPRVDAAERLEVVPLDHGFYRVILRYGFMEEPDVPAELARVRLPGLELDLRQVSYFLSRETLLATAHPGMCAVAREALRLDDAQRAAGDLLLQPAAQPRRRAGHAGRALSAVRAPRARPRTRRRRRSA